MKIKAIDFGCGCRAVPEQQQTPVVWTMEYCPMHKAAPELYAAYKFGLESSGEKTLIKLTLLNDPRVYLDDYTVVLTLGGQLYGRFVKELPQDLDGFKRLTEDAAALRQEMDDAIRKMTLSMLGDWLNRVDCEQHRRMREKP